MSRAYFYSQQHTPQFRFTSFDSITTQSIWTPTTSTRVVLTDLTISSNLGGTILITIGNLAGSKVFEFFVGSSSTISPSIGAIESTAYDRSFFAAPSQSGTNGWKVTAMGFEID